MTKTEINLDQKSKSLQVTMHIYIDDLEKEMQNSGMPKTYFASDKEINNADEILTRYLQSRFKLNIEGRPLKWSWLGKEVSEDFLALWCYLEVDDAGLINEISIQNDVLLDLYEDQTNIVETRTNNKTKRTSVIKAKGKKVILNF